MTLTGKIQRLLYLTLSRSAYFLAYPVLLAFALGGSEKWRNRLGWGFDVSSIFKDNNSDSKRAKLVWAHAASVGELRALSILIHKYLGDSSETKALITVMTDTGHTTARNEFQDYIEKEMVAVRYLPLDWCGKLGGVIKSTSPELFIFIETEIWPRWIEALDKTGVAIALVNARISLASFPRYFFFRSWIGSLLNRYAIILAQSEGDKERFLALGVRAEKIHVTGNLKFSARARIFNSKEREKILDSLGLRTTDKILVAGSVRPAEENGLIRSFVTLKKEFPNLKLVIAPRHMNRVENIIDISSTEKISHRKFSDNGSDANNDKSETELVLVDVYGKLDEIYGVADAAFVGGTMAPIGGHNLLEPALRGAPTLFGPYTENVQDSAEALIKGNHGQQISDWSEFENVMGNILLGKREFDRLSDTLASDSPISKTLERLSQEFPGLGFL